MIQPRWLEQRLGIGEPKELMLLEADQDLPPEIRKMDLRLVDRSAGNKRPRSEGSIAYNAGLSRIPFDRTVPLLLALEP